MYFVTIILFSLVGFAFPCEVLLHDFTSIVVGESLKLSSKGCGVNVSYVSSLSGPLPVPDVLLPSGFHHIFAKGMLTQSAPRRVFVKQPDLSFGSVAMAMKSIFFDQSRQPPISLPFSGYVNTIGPVIDGLISHPESDFPTDVSSAVGNGLAAATISTDGRIASVRLNGPSGLDQIERFTPVGLREAPDYMGVAAALIINGTVRWLHKEHVVNQTYEAGVDVVKTVFSVGHVLVEQNDFAPPGHRGLIRTFEVSNTKDEVELLVYANFAPCAWRVPLIPASDWLLDLFNGGYGSFVDKSADALVSFQPHTANFTPIINILNSSKPVNLSDFVRSLDRLWPSGGSFVAMGPLMSSSAAPWSLWAIPVAGSGEPNPFSKLRNSVVFGRSAFVLNSGRLTNGQKVSVAVTGGHSADAALAALKSVRSVGSEELLRQTRADWANWLATCNIPESPGDERVTNVMRAGFLAVRASQCNATGLIVASINSQVPYAFDWPRDGAFMTLALMEAGKLQEAVTHAKFYVAAMRKTGPFSGSFGMNFAFEGGKIIDGGPVPLEIDQIGMVLYMWGQLSERLRLIESSTSISTFDSFIWPAANLSLEFILRWKDNKTGLPLPANNDDNFAFKEGCQDAVSLLAGLNASLPLAKRQASDSMYRQLEERHIELRNAIMTHFNGSAGFCISSTPVFNKWRGATWFLWPAEVFPLTSTQSVSQAVALWNHVVRDFVDGKPGLYRYVSEQLLALSVQLRQFAVEGRESDAPFSRKLLTKVLGLIAEHATTQETFHFSEWSKCARTPSDQFHCETLNDVPHSYEHSLFYLSALNILN